MNSQPLIFESSNYIRTFETKIDPQTGNSITTMTEEMKNPSRVMPSKRIVITERDKNGNIVKSVTETANKLNSVVHKDSKVSIYKDPVTQKVVRVSEHSPSRECPKDIVLDVIEENIKTDVESEVKRTMMMSPIKVNDFTKAKVPKINLSFLGISEEEGMKKLHNDNNLDSYNSNYDTLFSDSDYISLSNSYAYNIGNSASKVNSPSKKKVDYDLGANLSNFVVEEEAFETAGDSSLQENNGVFKVMVNAIEGSENITTPKKSKVQESFYDKFFKKNKEENGDKKINYKDYTKAYKDITKEYKSPQPKKEGEDEFDEKYKNLISSIKEYEFHNSKMKESLRDKKEDESYEYETMFNEEEQNLEDNIIKEDIFEDIEGDDNLGDTKQEIKIIEESNVIVDKIFPKETKEEGCDVTSGIDSSLFVTFNNHSPKNNDENKIESTGIKETPSKDQKPFEIEEPKRKEISVEKKNNLKEKRISYNGTTPSKSPNIGVSSTKNIFTDYYKLRKSSKSSHPQENLTPPNVKKNSHQHSFNCSSCGTKIPDYLIERIKDEIRREVKSEYEKKIEDLIKKNEDLMLKLKKEEKSPEKKKQVNPYFEDLTKKFNELGKETKDLVLKNESINRISSIGIKKPKNSEIENKPNLMRNLSYNYLNRNNNYDFIKGKEDNVKNGNFDIGIKKDYSLKRPEGINDIINRYSGLGRNESLGNLGKRRRDYSYMRSSMFNF